MSITSFNMEPFDARMVITYADGSSSERQIYRIQWQTIEDGVTGVVARQAHVDSLPSLNSYTGSSGQQFKVSYRLFKYGRLVGETIPGTTEFLFIAEVA